MILRRVQQQLSHQRAALSEWIRNGPSNTVSRGGCHMVSGNAEYTGPSCPIKLGDVLKGRYRIVAEVGHGRTAIVWAAHDNRRHQWIPWRRNHFVALKTIYEDEDVRPDNEARIVSELQASDNCGHAPVPRYFDAFSHSTSDGVFDVYAMELLGLSLQDFADGRSFQFEGLSESPFATSAVRGLAYQMIQAVAHVHSRGILHRDLHLGNFLFRSPATSAQMHKRLRQLAMDRSSLFGRTLAKLSTMTAVSSQHEESHLALMDLETTLSDSEAGLVISDFSAACNYIDADDGNQTYSLTFRPPELVLGMPLSYASDVWALSCTIFNLVFNCSPFHADKYAEGEEGDLDFLQGLVESIGPLPSTFVDTYQGRTRYDLGLLVSRDEPSGSPLTDFIDLIRPSDMSRAETRSFEDLMRSVFQFDPTQRPSAYQMLDHPWLKWQT